MGFNLYSCCHKCKVKLFHYRMEENLAILPFYIKHAKCAAEDLSNVQTIMDNNNMDQKWQEDYRNGGYRRDSLYKKSTPKIVKDLYKQKGLKL